MQSSNFKETFVSSGIFVPIMSHVTHPKPIHDPLLAVEWQLLRLLEDLALLVKPALRLYGVIHLSHIELADST